MKNIENINDNFMESSDQLLLLAFQLMEQGKIDQALTTCEILLSKDKENINANLLFVEIATNKRNYRIAEEKVYFLQKLFVGKNLDDRQKEKFINVYKNFITLRDNDDSFMFDKI